MKAIRLSGVILLVVTLVILGLLAQLSINSWFKGEVEEKGGEVNGASVSLASTSLSLLKGGLALEDLEVANPDDLMRNRLQVNTLEFDVAWLPLLQGKLHVEQLNIQDLILDGKRDSAAKKIERSITSPGSWQWPEAVANEAKEVDVDAILTQLDIQSPKKFEAFSEGLDSKKTEWQTAIKQLPDEAKIAEYEQRYKDIRQREKKAKGLEKLSVLKDLKKLVREVKGEKEAISSLNKKLKNDIKQTRGEWSALQKQVGKDADLALSIASMSPEGMRHVASSLLGKEMAHWLELLVSVMSKVNPPATEQEQTKPSGPREGIDVLLPGMSKEPDFWVQQAALGGDFRWQALAGRLNGEAKNLTNALLPGQKTDVALSIDLHESEGKANLQSSIMHPDSHKKPLQLSFNMTDWPIQQWLVGGAEGVALTDIDAQVNLSAHSNYNQFAVEMDISLSNYKVATQSENSAKLINSLSKLLQQADQIEMKVTLTGDLTHQDVKLSSNLDDLLYNQVKGELKEKSKQVKQKVQAKIEQQVASVSKKIESQLAGMVQIEDSLSEAIQSLDKLK
ncbi:TIGR03545 family protein [Pleionea sp. CnH1-48]|uniref:TIGR03545 family protein n=1 Tax=Pleionea sp. CnH1-48 TaxID=2954494 RepID=UPI00209852A4|nr:TIGR03545 family protein [Pleionea sp. CnH1-48]MCO7226791.1 TIGR03545 family protein [Pleionea sp. CnH1-48]